MCEEKQLLTRGPELEALWQRARTPRAALARPYWDTSHGGGFPVGFLCPWAALRPCPWLLPDFLRADSSGDQEWHRPAAAAAAVLLPLESARFLTCRTLHTLAATMLM